MLNGNNNSFPGALIIGTFEKRASEWTNRRVQPFAARGGGGGYTQMPDFYVIFASKNRPVCDFIIQIWEVTFHFSNDRNLTLFNISLISLSSD